MSAQAGATARGGLRRDQASGAALLALAVYVAFAAREYPFGSVAEPGPGFLPFALAVVLGLLAIGVIVRAKDSPPLAAVSFADARHALLILAIMGAAAFAIERLGFRLTVIIMLAVLLGAVERKPPAMVVALSLAVAFGTFYLINNLLRVPLPLGPWGF